MYNKGTENRQTLTARQVALNKLSRSGLNDRALLLGNEAAALKGLI
jgi:CHASE2 domain-containing sensor protein